MRRKEHEKKLQIGKEGVADRGGRTQVARVLLRPRLPSRACRRDAAMGAGWMDARCGESRWMGRWGDAARHGCCGRLPPSSARAWYCGGGTRKGKEMSDLGIARWWKGAGAGGRAVPKRATGRVITRSISIGRNRNMVKQHHSSHDLGAARLCCRVRGELGLFELVVL